MPAFFRRDDSIPNGELFSFNGNLTAPFTLDSGGYLSYLDLNSTSSGWQQVTADMAHTKTQRHAGTSRGDRRRTYHAMKTLVTSTAP